MTKAITNRTWIINAMQREYSMPNKEVKYAN